MSTTVSKPFKGHIIESTPIKHIYCKINRLFTLLRVKWLFALSARTKLQSILLLRDVVLWHLLIVIGDINMQHISQYVFNPFLDGQCLLKHLYICS